jgi:7-carboxy-7-deazaguanine synthase (Cx14CxxC type)
MYSVKEMFFTLQGEGKHSGRPAVFCRFSGCNLWTGREQDRTSAVCTFCDTDFIGTNGQNGGKFADASTLAAEISSYWPGDKASAHSGAQKYVVCTGGEPLLQLDTPLIEALHREGFEVAVESNGTIAAPSGIDWICVSPKADAPLVQKMGSELKLVFPQALAKPERFEGLAFDNFLLQPLDDDNYQANVRASVDYCLAHPQWQLSLQTHKYLGID